MSGLHRRFSVNFMKLNVKKKTVGKNAQEPKLISHPRISNFQLFKTVESSKSPRLRSGNCKCFLPNVLSSWSIITFVVNLFLLTDQLISPALQQTLSSQVWPCSSLSLYLIMLFEPLYRNSFYPPSTHSNIPGGRSSNSTTWTRQHKCKKTPL